MACLDTSLSYDARTGHFVTTIDNEGGCEATPLGRLPTRFVRRKGGGCGYARRWIDRSTADRISRENGDDASQGVGAVGVCAWIATLAAGEVARAFEFPGSVPTTVVHSQDFAGAQGIPALWQVALGTWQADGQTYNSTVATNAAVTTIFEYQSFSPEGGGTTDYLPWPEFTFAARLRNQQTGAAALAGLVYSYVDPSNYYEVAFSPTGLAHLRRMNRGQMETLATATYAGGGQRMWFAVELQRTDSAVSVSVNGVPVFTGAAQAGSSGQVVVVRWDSPPTTRLPSSTR